MGLPGLPGLGGEDCSVGLPKIIKRHIKLNSYGNAVLKKSQGIKLHQKYNL